MWSAGKSTFKPGNHPTANLAGRLCRSPGTPMGPPFCQTTSSFVATDCGIPICNPTASWSDYTWSTCSQSCGGGTRTGVRECIDGDVGQGTCIGPVSTTEMCNTEDCPPPEDGTSIIKM
uniref:Semaphorin-5B-like n=1 Tax=Phallusia mammillata TaxID=59560 RepID=A0A6F9DSL7_9ASCI|nr:semaphorin-5B-like [Phallusia mammillata]